MWFSRLRNPAASLERSYGEYSAALARLLAKDSRNKVTVGDSVTVFWADRQTSVEDFFAGLFGDNPDVGIGAVSEWLQAERSGKLPSAEGETRFFVLGLAPNAARISVRFWLHSPLAELAPHILQHFRDLAIVRQFDSDPTTPSLSRLLRALAVQEKSKNVPPRLAGEWVRAILEGLPYPQMLLNAAVMRCRAEQATKDARGNVSYLRAAILKAWLNRDHRRQNPQLSPDHAHFKEELDVTQPDVPYRLGRLFAVLERIQEDSARPAKLNATIRDRYYGAASTTPVAVFTTLLRLKNAHLKKLGVGAQTHFERLIGEIFGTIETPALDDFPAQLTLPEQGRFALGYYHQRQSFFTRKGQDTGETEPKEE